MWVSLVLKCGSMASAVKRAEDFETQSGSQALALPLAT